jgi:GT2 family glycosyltransferase
MSKLSIIIVTYNSEKLIGPCLDSILKTTANLDSEIIIIDNNSQDGTVNLVKTQFPQVRLTENKENVGFARAVNQGVKLAQGKFILLLNPDMRVLDKAILDSLEFLENDKKIGIVGGQLLYHETLKIQASFGKFPSLFTEFLYAFGLHKIFPWGRFIPKNIFSKGRFEKTHQVDWLGGGYMMINREVFDKVGLFDKNFFMYLEDIDFCYRAKNAGWRVYYFPKAKIVHHHMASSKKDISKPIIYEAKSLIYYFKKYKKSFGVLKFLIRPRLNLRILIYFLPSLFSQEFKELFEANKKAKKEI